MHIDGDMDYRADQKYRPQVVWSHVGNLTQPRTPIFNHPFTDVAIEHNVQEERTSGSAAGEVFLTADDAKGREDDDSVLSAISLRVRQEFTAVGETKGWFASARKIWRLLTPPEIDHCSTMAKLACLQSSFRVRSETLQNHFKETSATISESLHNDQLIINCLC